jgi:hypothetical protein
MNKEARPMGFKPGVSGNPAGRPRGTRTRATLAVESLFAAAGEQLAKAALDQARGGDPLALRFCLARLLPVTRSRPLQLSLPDLACAADAVTASAQIIAAVAAGDITPADGNELLKLMESHTRLVQAVEIEARLKRIEEALDLEEKAA